MRREYGVMKTDKIIFGSHSFVLTSVDPVRNVLKKKGCSRYCQIGGFIDS